MAVEPRPGRPLGIVEMQALEEGEADLPIELLPYRLDSGDHIVPRSVQMSRVQAKRRALAGRGGNLIAERPQLPESAPKRGSRTRRALDQQPHVTGDGGQALGVSARVASKPGGAVVHVVPGMRHDPADPEGPTALELSRERLGALVAERGVRGGQIIEVTLVRHDGVNAVDHQCLSECRDLLGAHGRLAPLLRRLREYLYGGGADGRAPGRGERQPAEGRDVGAEQFAVVRHTKGSSVKASREMSGTKRTPPARRSVSPVGRRSMMNNSCVTRSPIGITRRPPVVIPIGDLVTDRKSTRLNSSNPSTP